MSSRILIAEDEGRIASFLEKGLRANGFATELAKDGDEALRLSRSGRFDLLILDLGLPGKDGFAVLRELRDEGRALPVSSSRRAAGSATPSAASTAEPTTT